MKSAGDSGAEIVTSKDVPEKSNVLLLLFGLERTGQIVQYFPSVFHRLLFSPYSGDAGFDFLLEYLGQFTVGFDQRLLALDLGDDVPLSGKVRKRDFELPKLVRGQISENSPN